MSGDELTFLQSLESEQKKGMPQPFALGKEDDIVRLAFNRKLNSVTGYRDWVVIAMQPPDFRNIVKTLITSVAIEDESSFKSM
jgi:hypothetical protein